MPWHDTEAEAVEFVRGTAQQIVEGSIDPYRGASQLWHSALLIRASAPWPYLGGKV